MLLLPHRLCREKAAEIARAREAEAEAELDEWAGMIEIEDEGDGAGDVRVCVGADCLPCVRLCLAVALTDGGACRSFFPASSSCRLEKRILLTVLVSFKDVFEGPKFSC